MEQLRFSSTLKDPHPQQFFFRRRGERLDWRKVASLDLEKTLQDGSTTDLEEFITPVLFCKADSEFDQEKTDPGFIKVFRLSQLIGEILIFQNERDKQSLRQSEERCKGLEELRIKLSQDIGTLKETLATAKKEMKKTKEILAQTQTQLLGHENLDELDQCPYCNKRFIAPYLLLAHLQRRHQGLPIPLHLQQQSYANSTTTMFPFHQLQGDPALTNINMFRSPGMALSAVPSSGLGGTPTVYAFTMSPNGTVTNKNVAESQNNKDPTENNNNNNLVERRRSSSTQTADFHESLVNVSEGEIHPRNNEDETVFPSLKVIKSPAASHTNESDSETNLAGNQDEIDHQIRPLSRMLGPSDLQVISDLVEKYLEQKSISGQNQHYDQILKSIYTNINQFPHSPTFEDPQVALGLATTSLLRSSAAAAAPGTSAGSPSFPVILTDANVTARDKLDEKDSEGLERNVMRMKDEFEAHWTQLSQKVQDSGVDELKTAFLTEIKKVQDMILNVPKPIGDAAAAAAAEKESEKVQEDDDNKSEKEEMGEEDGLKLLENEMTMAHQFQKLSSELQAKMKEELENVKGKLASQEEFWRSHLKSLEEQHRIQIQKLEKDLKRRNYEVSEDIPNDGKNYQEGFEEDSLDTYCVGDTGLPEESHHNIHHKHPTSSPLHGHPTTTRDAFPHKLTENEHASSERESISITGGDSRHGINLGHGQDMVKPTHPGFNLPTRKRVEREIPDLGLIPQSSSEAEAEYLTIIHAEADPEYLDRSEEEELGIRRGVKRREHADEERVNVTGSQPQNLRDSKEADNDYDNEVSDYYYYEESEESLSEGESLAIEEGTTTNRDSRRPPTTTTKYVFDQAQGKIIDVRETRSQMDLVRDRMVLNDLDKQMEELGLDPAASAIGIDEMARALKHLKAEGRLRENADSLEKDVKDLRKQVKYEAVKRSLQGSLEKFEGHHHHHKDAGRFSTIFQRVKKSGKTWKQKVASAMRKGKAKPSSPPPTKEGKDPLDMKTTFFSKKFFSKKKANNAKENNALPSTNSSEDEEEEETSTDVEEPPHPYLTRSQPLLHKNPGETEEEMMRESRRKFRKRFPDFGGTTTANEIATGSPPRNKKDIKPIPKPRGITTTNAKSATALSTASPQRDKLRGELMSELRSKISLRNEHDSHSSTTEQQQQRELDHFQANKPPPQKYKGPNFFVHGSPQTTSPAKKKVAAVVTSNGWGSTTTMQKNVNKSPSKSFGKYGEPSSGDISNWRQESPSGSASDDSEPSIRLTGTTSKAKARTTTSGSRDDKVVENAVGDEYHNSSSHQARGISETEDEDSDSEYFNKRKQELGQGFARSDGKRKGFRTPSKSAHSLSDEDHDGRGSGIGNETSSRNISNRDTPAEGQFFTGKVNPPTRSREDVLLPLPKRGTLKPPSPISSSTSPAGNISGSDTSVWDTEEEVEIHGEGHPTDERTRQEEEQRRGNWSTSSTNSNYEEDFLTSTARVPSSSAAAKWKWNTIGEEKSNEDLKHHFENREDFLLQHKSNNNGFFTTNYGNLQKQPENTKRVQSPPNTGFDHNFVTKRRTTVTEVVVADVERQNQGRRREKSPATNSWDSD